MTIDIINYTEDQFAALSTEKLEEIRSAQLKKNRLAAALEEKLKAEKQKLVDKGAYPSDVWGKIEEKLRAKYTADVQIIRDGLLFFLHYVAEDENKNTSLSGVPYKVDYSLSEEERMLIVKEYYETTYVDAAQRYTAFKEDSFVKVYIGELYLPLHDYFYVP
jgi:hypothetical protein